jgi:riboflavin kinase/FMN adenylyltransferase
MKVIDSLEPVRLKGVVLTIGNFDGVHRGHQAILAAGRRRADAVTAPLVAMTFDPHPLAILTPEHVPPALTPLDEKLHLLELHRADIAVVVRSSRAFLQLTADDFIQQIVLDRFRPAAMVEGASFGFGRKRQGDVYMLQAAGRQHGFEVEIVEPVRVALGGKPDAVISSSLVRQLLGSGAVSEAAACLGHPYALTGTVVHGAGRGRSLGFPTANVAPTSQMIPAEGVYAGRARLDRQETPAAISIGHNPTFGGQSVIVEAHLLDYREELYDHPIRIEFLEWLRPQHRFESPEALIEQIARDVARTREACRTLTDQT